VVVAAGPSEVVGVGDVKAVVVLLLLTTTVICARCNVRVLVRVKVLVEVVVVRSSATATSGRRTAARMVGRCILSGYKCVVESLSRREKK
jgi:DNA-directed RNA polymerase subunit RPC12/RpoP